MPAVGVLVPVTFVAVTVMVSETLFVSPVMEQPKVPVVQVQLLAPVVAVA